MTKLPKLVTRSYRDWKTTCHFVGRGCHLEQDIHTSRSIKYLWRIGGAVLHAISLENQGVRNKIPGGQKLQSCLEELVAAVTW